MTIPDPLSPDAAGPRDPASSTPSLPTGAWRRTTHVDVGPTSGSTWTDRSVVLEIAGVVRDVRRVGEQLSVLDVAELDARLDEERRLDRVLLDPPLDTSALTGGPVAGGFRSTALDLVDDVGSPQAVLLRDLPTAIVILAGYAHVRGLREAGVPAGKLTPPSLLDGMADLCSGWRRDGVMVTSVARGDGVPFQDCPPAPDLGDGWHVVGELAEGWARRRRRIDVVPERDGWYVDAMFRDSFHSLDADQEQVLHEYGLSARLDRRGRLLAVTATPRVLPFVECPLAADNVDRLVGSELADLRDAVTDELSGVAGCTHMNDLVVALSDVDRALGPGAR